ncbi:ferritin-like domain-containing protein [Sporolituus thermophilus]|uniref:Rubrerythrin n=1 Tax=Sporolituus thermophilus DSM 23256 TaxID=1123285 RepID=A0A1G7NWB5_9FIRM|nr:ferritin-like domain-containing protein [Sporolituus thermophilus]SDF78261.1 Rubrerythrin [Sporolituus thermophilus DSM 23256]
MAKPTCSPAKASYGCHPSCMPDMDECPNHPDLYLLRDAAADERGAIADYLTCAAETCLEIFLDVAEDEMRHYVETMRLISLFDPVQAEMLEEQDLDFLVMKRPGKPKWPPTKKAQYKQDVEVVSPNKKDLPAIHCLTKAIQDELHAINKYQRYMNEAEDPRVKNHFCELMNDEKEHVAEFTAALFKLTHEPLPEETD